MKTRVTSNKFGNAISFSWQLCVTTIDEQRMRTSHTNKKPNAMQIRTRRKKTNHVFLSSP